MTMTAATTAGRRGGKAEFFAATRAAADDVLARLRAGTLSSDPRRVEVAFVRRVRPRVAGLSADILRVVARDVFVPFLIRAFEEEQRAKGILPQSVVLGVSR